MLNTKIITTVGGVIFVLMGLLAWRQTAYERAKTELDQAIQYNLAKDDTLVYIRTLNGQLSSRTQVLDLTIRNLEKLQADRDLQWLKHIEGINKRMNNVEQIMTTTARVVGSFNIPLRDTIIFFQDGSEPTSGRIFDNKYEWFHLKGIILEDSLLVTPDVPVPLQSVVYWERRKGFLGLRWFGKKEWFKQTTSSNPYVRITEDKLIRITKKKKK